MSRPVLALALLAASLPALAGDDPYLWLEEVEGDKPLAWAREHNTAVTAAVSEMPGFDALKGRLLEIYDSTDNIAYVGKIGQHYYNFWRDAEHPRGVWRRTSLESYRTDAPEWDVVIDLDAVAEAEGENWVWGGASCLPPDYNRCLVSLSRGGADATVTREYDIGSRDWVVGGFYLPEAKGDLSWIDLDNVYVSTDFGEGALTDSGYPRIVKQWTRGTSLEQAKTIFEGKTQDISVGAWHDSTPGFERDFVYRGLTFYTNERYLRTSKGLQKIDKPDHANVSVWREHILFEPREDWTVGDTTYKAGSLLAGSFKKWMKGKRDLTVLFEPTDATALEGFSATEHHLLLNSMDTVRSKVEILTPGKKGWTRKPLPGGLELGLMSASAVDDQDGDAYWLSTQGFLTPATLSYGVIGEGEAQPVKAAPSFFDAEGLTVAQHMATSKDGTKVPYFIVHKQDVPLDGTNKTLLYGYGGFEVSMRPSYSATIGAAWLEKGGVYVLANIRGGGEFGPKWHQAALKQDRHKAYEDFAAVAQDLVTRKITSVANLGTRGGSNGGLLMGNMYTMYPDTFGAIVCQVPLLDMKRYNKLLAGASWMGEYGNPDVPEEWAFIESFSPYHNVDATKDYPPILVTTSTRDDRVHPAHARKFTALLEAVDKDVLYYENIEGGHGGAANHEQSAFMQAMIYAWLWETLGKDEAGTAE